MRPRRSFGANSLTSVLATGSSPPRPTPATNRISASDAADHASADTPVSKLYASSVHVNTALRPNRSATIPLSDAPRNIPIRLAVMIPPTDGLGEMPLAADRRDDGADQQQVHRVEQPAAARGQEKSSLERHVARGLYSLRVYSFSATTSRRKR